ncbi:small ribosomal subunit protein mS35-like [Watersipora subatra]|uniref:small ribosomal subunit protein mS35-like n=1 Tax=Watersipora subatra TaxID=2589382 RepID=UPI00355BB82C
MAAPRLKSCLRLRNINKTYLASHTNVHNLINFITARTFTGKGIPPMPKCDKRDKDGFRIYRIPGLHKDPVEQKKSPFKMFSERPPPREKVMKVDQDWTNVWPTAASFKPSVVPLPIRQGYVKNAGENQGIIPYKYHNMELMKVINFLHLTPRHISKHCAALKKFCTPWPQELNEEGIQETHFPLSITTCDYVYSHSTIRDPRSRLVTMKFKMSCLDLDYHAKDKMIRLLGDRYDQETDEVTIQSDKCPIQQQNSDYIAYLLTALYYESWKVEEWEGEKTWADLEAYDWERSKAKEKIERLQEKLPQARKESWSEDVGRFAEAVTRLHNEGESKDTLNDYKSAVLAMLKLRTDSTPSNNAQTPS